MAAQGFTIDHLLRVERLTTRVPLHLSPDGRHLALSVARARRAAPLGEDQSFDPHGVPIEASGSRVLVADTSTGTARSPFPPGSTSWGAQWSPNGMLLAAYVQHERPACLGIWDVDQDRVRLFPEVRVRPFFGFEVPRWTPDGRSVVVKLVASSASGTRAQGPPPTGRAAPSLAVFSFDPRAPPGTAPLPGWADGYRCDLARVDVTTGAIARLAIDWSLIGWRVAPDGRAVAVLRYTQAEEPRQQFYYDLAILPLDSAPPRVIATHIPQDYGISFNWAPDARHIAYTAKGLHGRQPGRLFVVSADGAGAPGELTGEEDLGLEAEYEAPRWHADGRRLFCLSPRGILEFAADGSMRRLLRTGLEHEVLGWAQRPTAATCWMPAEGKLLLLLRDPATQDLVLARVGHDEDATVLARLPKAWRGAPFGLELAPDGSRLYACLEASDHPDEIWQFGARFDEARPLLSFNPALAGQALGASRLIEWRALDGAQRRGTLVLPPGHVAGQRVPVIAEIYLGALGSHERHRFGGAQGVLHAQVLAGRGYAVLYPDMPAVERDPLHHLPGQVLPALDRLIELGIADPERLGVMGHSYGGYCVQALLTQTSRFRAAVSSAGDTNLTSVYGAVSREGHSPWVGWLEAGQGRAGGSLWERRDAYIENSPLFYLDRVSTPLLLVCGSAHPEEPQQAGEAFSALRRLGKRVELRIYRGEGHWPGTWSEASFRDVCERILAWFDTCLDRA